MNFQPTVSISFPRSGHHLLVQLLRAYCGSSFNYCEVYKRGHLLECAETNYLKTHDFDLQFQTPENWREIVQIRDPVEAIESWFGISPQDQADRQAFWDDKLKFYAAFMSKWMRPRRPHRIFVHYRHLIDEPYLTLWRVLRHVSIDQVDLDRLHDVVAAAEIKFYRGVRPCFAWGHERFSKNSAFITNPEIL